MEYCSLVRMAALGARSLRPVIAKEHKLNDRAIFRGTAPNRTLTPETVKGLTNDGFDMDGWKPETVSGDGMKIACSIITFDRELPSNAMLPNVEQLNWIFRSVGIMKRSVTPYKIRFSN